VTLEDIAECETIFTLMGEDVEARRKFIEECAGCEESGYLIPNSPVFLGQRLK